MIRNINGHKSDVEFYCVGPDWGSCEFYDYHEGRCDCPNPSECMFVQEAVAALNAMGITKER